MTLILLSVITLMAVAFLVMSTAQRNASVSAVDQAIAKNAANNALERALAEVTANIMASGNEFNYDLLVPTNYLNTSGFVTGNSSPTNVNYDYTTTGGALSANDALQNLANLLINPRAPVFINNPATRLNEFRYYLDLNRNGRFDPTGWVGVTDGSGFTNNVNGVPAFAYAVGDPQWIGALEFPDRPHSADNRFTFRYTYLVLPVSKTLDMNYIHNAANSVTKANSQFALNGSDFRRNQGVGTWEINFASFLFDLNTNFWDVGYTYNPLPNAYTPLWSSGPIVGGNAFIDAFSLLTNRYAGVPSSLYSVSQLYSNGTAAFVADSCDGYTAGPFMVTNWHPLPDPDFARTTRPWPGANNTNHFSRPGEFFDPTKSSVNFVTRLQAAGTNLSTYNRYTFYRMLAQLGTDSAVESAVPGSGATATRVVTGWQSDSASSNLLVTVPNHNTFVGDWVTLTSGNPPNYQRTFKVVSVRDANHYVLQGAALGPQPAGSTVAVDRSENAKIDLNYDNINTSREAFTNWTAGDFFNASADRMLRRQIGMYLGYIPVYPPTTNLYTASIHRLLQLAANIYDSTTNRTFNISGVSNGFPTIFRPIFRYDQAHGLVVIAGYRELTDHFNFVKSTTAPTNIDLAALPTNNIATILPTLLPPLGTPFDPLDRNEPLVAGYPLIVGAKTGYPNFNEFEMQTQLQITRKLEFINTSPDLSIKNLITNQMYLISVSNVFGVEAWNSYSNTYPRALQMTVVADMSEVILTNQPGPTNQLGPFGAVPVHYGFPYPVVNLYTNEIQRFTNQAPIVARTWTGFDDLHHPQYVPLSFQTPFRPSLSNSYFFFHTNSSFSSLANCFVVPYQTNFEQLAVTPTTGPFPVPNWWLLLKVRFRFILFDQLANRIVDYVDLESNQDPIDLTQALLDGAHCGTSQRYVQDAFIGSMWCTNRLASLGTGYNIPTYGIWNQIGVCLGTNTANLDWRSWPQYAQMDLVGAENFFRTNLLNWPPLPGRSSTLSFLTNHFYAPFAPTRNLYFYTSWKANDPLVHYTIGDLTPMGANKTNAFIPDTPNLAATTIKNIGAVNDRYEPWGGYGAANGSSPTLYNLAVKDPQVHKPSDWDFPTNKYANLGWLGRVHRGTPWQTVYLKSPPTDLQTWQHWSGNGQFMRNIGQIDTNRVPLGNVFPDAGLTIPTNDWRLLDIFTTGFNDNSTLGRLNINQTNLAAWSAILGGVITLTNTLSDADIGANPLGVTPQFAPLIINPAGYYDLSNTNVPVPPLVRIVNAINNVRATNNGARAVFDHLGDLLATPELTVSSPFLNTNTANLLNSGITDAAYERIPQQILGLINCDHTPRFVIYSWGQALKPADRSVLSSGPFINLCTNYQITAEVATRTVVRIDGAPNNPHAVIENFNILPPD